MGTVAFSPLLKIGNRPGNRPLELPTSPSASSTTAANALERVRLLSVQVRTRKQFAPIHFGPDIKNVVLDWQGYLCTTQANKHAKEHLTSPTCAHINGTRDGIRGINIGFTKRSIRRALDFADHVAQSFGDKIIVKGNSLGGFGAQAIAVSLPDIVDFLILTSSPHLLSIQKELLKEHTNIELYLALMTLKPLKPIYDHEMMSTYDRILRNDLAEEIQALKSILDAKPIATWMGTHDGTVRTQMGLYRSDEDFELLVEFPKPNRRNMVVNADHADVIRGAIPSMVHIIEHGFDAVFPEEIRATLEDFDSIEEMLRRTPGEVGRDFVASSLAPGLLQDLLRGQTNVPQTLISKIRKTQPPALEAPALQLVS